MDREKTDLGVRERESYSNTVESKNETESKKDRQMGGGRHDTVSEKYRKMKRIRRIKEER